MGGFLFWGFKAIKQQRPRFPEDKSKFQERFKKELNRTSTKAELIDKYLDFLYSLEKFKEAGYIRPQCYSDDILDPESAKMMKALSRELSEMFAPLDYEE